MELQQLIDAMETIAPTARAESWDNVGLLAGDPRQAVSRAMLTIDYTAEVAAEAENTGCDAVIAYHPPIFNAIKRVVAGGSSSLIHDAIHRGVALYSPHTALDVAEGGTNDLLADVIGLNQRQPLRPLQDKSSQYKLVTFVPEEAVGRISQALFAAGAGHVGNYSSCSFRTSGTGTFFGEAGSHPSVGISGKLETTAEIRLEMTAPISRLQVIIQALRQAHPYEEPAFDLVKLAATPHGLGQGRTGSFAAPVTVNELILRIKRELDIGAVLVAGAIDRPVNKAAVCAGACGDMLDDAIAAGVDFYLTGEMRHHDAIKAAQAGMTVICTLHSNSERAVLKRLKNRLEQMLPTVEFSLSQVDADPFSIR